VLNSPGENERLTVDRPVGLSLLNEKANPSIGSEL